MLDQRITKTYIELADTLVLGFDIIDFLHTLTERCVELLDVDAAGILLADQRGALSLMAASTEQLQTALNSRILIEQAKGILSARRQVDIAEAFALMRTFARNHNRLLSQVAQEIITQSPEVTALTTPSRG